MPPSRVKSALKTPEHRGHRKINFTKHRQIKKNVPVGRTVDNTKRKKQSRISTGKRRSHAKQRRSGGNTQNSPDMKSRFKPVDISKFLPSFEAKVKLQNQQNLKAKDDLKGLKIMNLPNIFKTDPVSNSSDQKFSKLTANLTDFDKQHILQTSEFISFRIIGQNDYNIFVVCQSVNFDLINTILAKYEENPKSDIPPDENLNHMCEDLSDSKFLSLPRVYLSLRKKDIIQRQDTDNLTINQNLRLSLEEILKSIECSVLTSFIFETYNSNRRSIRILNASSFESFSSLVGKNFSSKI